MGSLEGEAELTSSAHKRAKQILHYAQSCTDGKVSSAFCHSLPAADSDEADEIAKNLFDVEPSTILIPRTVRRLKYELLVRKLKQSQEQTNASNLDGIDLQWSENVSLPTPAMFEAARSVLAYLHATRGVPVDFAMQALNEYLSENAKLADEMSVSRRLPDEKLKRLRKCYMCRFKIGHPHDQYSELCRPCGDFNTAQSSISLPQALDLTGKIALVTGGRVNLGFHTALRLLRCGAMVMVSSRYPEDASVRYSACRDYPEWSNRLRIIGADFRSARDVFFLVAQARRQVSIWAKDGHSVVGNQRKLDILINNAAQTLTDSINSEKQAIEREGLIEAGKSPKIDPNIMKSWYEPKVRAGITTTLQNLLCSNVLANPIQGNKQELPAAEISILEQPRTSSGMEVSSWMQTLDSIPYEDVISAHSVNAFAPFILVRELLPSMGHITPSGLEPCSSTLSSDHNQKSRPLSSTLSSESPIKSTDRPLGYIVNVSSREGIFEDHPRASAKFGRHAHTNMSKAALNMLTETEAALAWRDRRVAINTVDPGYMSAAPEIAASKRSTNGKDKSRDAVAVPDKRKQNGMIAESCPIGWEDGAARVLWPIAIGESLGRRQQSGKAEDGQGGSYIRNSQECHGVAVWGRFLKHFGLVEVEVGMGR